MTGTGYTDPVGVVISGPNLTAAGRHVLSMSQSLGFLCRVQEQQGHQIFSLLLAHSLSSVFFL